MSSQEAPAGDPAPLEAAIVPQGPLRDPSDDEVPDDAALEAQGAVIGTITVDAANIFDKEDPKENKKLLRAADKLHVTTRPNVILRQLTFKTGDCYSRAALDESERHLRHNGYLYDATIRPVRYDGHTVDVIVHTRDVWTLRPGLNFKRSGGTNTLHFGIQDGNFLGLGKNVQIERRSSVDRVETGIDYVDPMFARTHARLEAGYSNNSDGKASVAAIDRGFWKVDEDWAAGIRGETNLRTDPLYALGMITDQFREDRTFFEGYYGRHLATVGTVTYRILSGFTYDHSLFSPLPQPGATNVLPADRTLSYPWIGFEIFHEAYVRAHDMDKLGRTEDFNLGRDLNVRLGFASPAFGADRSAGMVDIAWTSGFSPGAGQVITLAATADGRVTSTRVENGIATAAVRYYHRWAEWSLFFSSLSWTEATNLDADQQITLGGDNGLRGYPLRYAVGDRSILLTVEQRFYLDREFVHLFRLGAAVFADVGKAHSEDPNPASHLGVLKDVGLGVRIGQTRSAHANVVRIDVALPFDAGGTGLHPQLLVTTGETF
ncbi:MAG TPA: POTRA domain-containing protein [Candidatus Polarisedimenticolaceae bacterium]|nr:POTRA domain-containing protein [Candidatus Polarisedimenticolaceae bacterium]